MAIENTSFSDFDLRSSIVKSVFDCRLSYVKPDRGNQVDAA